MKRTNLVIPDIFNVIIDDLNDIAESVKIENPDKLLQFSRHNVMVINEVANLIVVWNRFAEEREKLLKVDLLSGPLFEAYKAKKLTQKGVKKLKLIWKHQNSLNSQLKVDLISLFIFIDIYLSKLVLLGKVIWGGDSRKIRYKSFTSFLKSLEDYKLDDPYLKGLYSALKPDMIWIESSLGFYRDKFITHVGAPYQEYFGHALFMPEINIEHISYELGNPKQDERVKSLIGKVRTLFPEIEGIDDIREKVHFLAKNLYKVDQSDIRGEIENVIRSVGIVSPDIYSLVSIVIKFSRDYIRYLKYITSKGRIPYGLVVTEYK